MANLALLNPFTLSELPEVHSRPIDEIKMGLLVDRS